MPRDFRLSSSGFMSVSRHHVRCAGELGRHSRCPPHFQFQDRTPSLAEPANQHRPVSPLLLERLADVGRPRIIPAVLDKLKDHELLALALKEPRLTLPVHFKPVLRLLPFLSATPPAPRLPKAELVSRCPAAASRRITEGRSARLRRTGGDAAVHASPAQPRFHGHHAGQEAGSAHCPAEGAGDGRAEQPDEESVFQAAGPAEGRCSFRAPRIRRQPTASVLAPQPHLQRYLSNHSAHRR
jgi:hypothetical protein